MRAFHPHLCLHPLTHSLLLAGVALYFLPVWAWAQSPASATTSAPSTTAPAAPATDLGQVEIRSNRNNDTEVRRESSASKIVIGREEIDKQGDSTLGEVLKRLPGVTVQGAPGRGGAIRMRGLGGGYTQILLDGERVPPGFSIDSLTPEQVEKIEIMRAPTAETGARAIAGTINIVLREGQKANPDDLKITRSQEHGEGSTMLSWVHNLKTQPLSGTVSLSLMDQYRPDESTSVITSDPGFDRIRSSQWLGHRKALYTNARLQWKGEQGRTLTLTPFVVYAENTNLGQVQIRQTEDVSLSDNAQSLNKSRYAMARLNGQWAQRLSADDRLEVRFGLGQSRYDYRLDQTGAADVLLFNGFETQNFVDRTGSLNGKWSRAMDNGHQIVSGLEFEGVRRVEEGNAAVNEDGGDIRARTMRWAAYAQDEFKINANWSAYTGLRYESILTEGTSDQGLKSNNSSVWTPLLHALWKPDPAKRDQVRMSLTRSYKTPTLYNLVARPVPSREANSPTRPDRVGNPDLRPEMATGIDVAFERYLAGGGVISANVFHRQITDLIRYTVAQQSSPSWAPGQDRWVSSPINLGDATTQGIELEAKFRLDQVRSGTLPVDIRSNLSLFSSRVKQVPGPDNRLDQQPGMTANLGADYRVRSIPVTVGGNLNWNPDYDTRRSEQQWAYQGTKRVLDVYGQWRFSSATALRLTVSNLTPRDYLTSSTYSGNGVSETSRNTSPSWRNVQLRLEMKI
jgi:outer membrane receptor for ferrienterochelin and colicins